MHQPENRFGRLSDKIKRLFHAASQLLLYLTVICIIIAALISFKWIPGQIGELVSHSSGSLREILEMLTGIIIAIELIHVLCFHTIDSFIDVLLMACTRELVLKELQTWEFLVGVIAIGILFAIRKYLFIKQVDHNMPGHESSDKSKQEDSDKSKQEHAQEES